MAASGRASAGIEITLWSLHPLHPLHHLASRSPRGRGRASWLAPLANPCSRTDHSRAGRRSVHPLRRVRIQAAILSGRHLYPAVRLWPSPHDALTGARRGRSPWFEASPLAEIKARRDRRVRPIDVDGALAASVVPVLCASGGERPMEHLRSVAGARRCGCGGAPSRRPSGTSAPP